MEKNMSFYDVDYNEMDRDLSPEQQREWTSIYASYRSRTPLTGTVIGVESHRLAVRNPETGETEAREIQCLVLMDFRVKVIIPAPEIWYNAEMSMPEYVVRRMVGAKVDYVITNVDREGECAIASAVWRWAMPATAFTATGRKTRRAGFCSAMCLSSARNGF